MFQVIRKNNNRLEITMGDSLNSEEMKIALDELVAKSEDIENGTLLFEVIDYKLPTLSAIAIEFSRLPSMFGWIRKFRRAAVLADKDWLKKISEFEGKLIPGLEIKGFNRDQRIEANKWLSS